MSRANGVRPPRRPGPVRGFSQAPALWLIAGVVCGLVIILTVTGIQSSGDSGGRGAAPGGAPSFGDPASEPEVPPSGPATAGAPVPAPTAPSIPLEAKASPAPGVTIAVGQFEAVDGEAERAGDVAGPAIRFTVSVSNATADPLSLSASLVNLYYGSDVVPAAELNKPGGMALPESVAPGATGSGTFVFTVPEDERDRVFITMDYLIGSPVIAFEGAVPD